MQSGGPAGSIDAGAGGSGLRLSFFWRALGALVLGVLLAKWVWVFFAPQAVSIAVAPPERGTAAEAGKLFGVAAAPVPASAAMETAALPNVRLVGVFAGKGGQSGFAVLKLDDRRQLGVAAGDAVAPGVRLAEIHPGYVLLERAGIRQRVNLEEKRK